MLPKIKPVFNNNANYKLYVWGSGKDGRCGNGKESGEKTPTLISSKHSFT